MYINIQWGRTQKEEEGDEDNDEDEAIEKALFFFGWKKGTAIWWCLRVDYFKEIVKVNEPI